MQPRTDLVLHSANTGSGSRRASSSTKPSLTNNWTSNTCNQQLHHFSSYLIGQYCVIKHMQLTTASFLIVSHWSILCHQTHATNNCIISHRISLVNTVSSNTCNQQLHHFSSYLIGQYCVIKHMQLTTASLLILSHWSILCHQTHATNNCIISHPISLVNTVSSNTCN